ncbi:MAG: hypothetical protein ACTFAL_10645 [Candidatus Electronema sp. V4]|uniref:hypothetical protein n=1 Tax=Candidatus Electronema sp. V4 TaxID=3454756 RepID=UPI0040555E92
MKSETTFYISLFLTIFSVLVVCLHFYARWRKKNRNLQLAVDEAQRLVARFVYRPLDEKMAQRRAKAKQDVLK